MKIKRRFGNKKQGNPKRGLALVILLIIVLYLFFNADKILGRLL